MAFYLNLIVLLACGIALTNCEPRFFIPNVKIDWIGAVEYCHRLGMRLAVVDNQSKNDAIVKLVQDTCAYNSKGTNVWIGANDLSKQGSYVWHDTGMKVNYTNWSQNNPDNSEGIEHCVEIALKDYTQWKWGWNDSKCHYQLNFVCEF